MKLIVVTITTLLLMTNVLSVKRSLKYGFSDKDCKKNFSNGAILFQLYSLVTFERGQNPIQTNLEQPIPCVKRMRDLPNISIAMDCPQIRYTEPDGSSHLSEGKTITLKKGEFSMFETLWNEHIKNKPFAIVSARTVYTKDQNNLKVTLGCVHINVLAKLEVYGMNFVEGQQEYELRDMEAHEKAIVSIQNIIKGMRDEFSKTIAKSKVLIPLDNQSKTDLVKAIQTRERSVSLIDTKGNALQLEISGDLFKIDTKTRDITMNTYI